MSGYVPGCPGPSPFLERADIVAVSRHDIPSDLSLRDIGAWVGDECDVLLTAGLVGGMLIRFRGRPHHQGAGLSQRALPR